MTRTIVAAALALAALPALAAPLVQNAWMRPAHAGAESADAYADIVTPTAVTLVRVRTPAARTVEIVLLDPKDPASAPKVVDKLELKSGETRFALRGSVLRLRDVKSTLTSERAVPLTFEFVDDAGAKSAVEVSVQVRGLLPPK